MTRFRLSGNFEGSLLVLWLNRFCKGSKRPDISLNESDYKNNHIPKRKTLQNLK